MTTSKRTPEKIAIMRAMALGGAYSGEIGKALGVTDVCIRNWGKAEGIALHTKSSAKKSHYNDPEFARRHRERMQAFSKDPAFVKARNDGRRKYFAEKSSRERAEARKRPPPILYGPYVAPVVVKGDWLMDEITSLTEVGGLVQSGNMLWPRRKKTGRASLILTGDLARAVRKESVSAIARHWGVGTVTVNAWRRALGVDRVTKGTRALLRERTGVPLEAAARGREKASSETARRKMADTKKGRPASAKTKAHLLKAAKAPKPESWGRRANEWMQAGKPKQSRGENVD